MVPARSRPEAPTGGAAASPERRYELERELARRLLEAGPEDRPGLYAEVYGEYTRLSGEPPLDERGVELQLRALEPHLSFATRFLEIGSGSGSLSRRVAGLVSEAWAVDAWRPERASAGGATAIRARGVEIDLPDASVDLAYSCHFVEHLHPDDAIPHAREVRRVLVPGGRYLCITPHAIWGPHDASRPFSAVADGLHLRRGGFRRLQASSPTGRPGPLGPLRLVEWSLSRCPSALRRRVLGLLARGREAPLRRLEQVALLATR